MTYIYLAFGIMIGIVIGVIWQYEDARKKCKKCGCKNLHRGTYTTGYNNYCRQASGDQGYMCDECLHIEFDLSFNVRKAVAEKYSPWVTVIR